MLSMSYSSSTRGCLARLEWRKAWPLSAWQHDLKAKYCRSRDPDTTLTSPQMDYPGMSKNLLEMRWIYQASMCGAAGTCFGVLFGNGMQTETQLELMQSSFSSMVCKIFYVSPFRFHPFHGPLALTQGFEATRTLFPPTRTCTNPDCPKRHAKSLLRRKDDPRKVILFTLSEGACPTYSIHLYCYGEHHLLWIFSLFSTPISFTTVTYLQDVTRVMNTITQLTPTCARTMMASQTSLKSVNTSSSNARS